MTKKLFWQDPYLTECQAKVTSIDGRNVKLDQTIFFAFSGGQQSDSGTINGINVIEAVKQGDKEAIIDIEYVLEQDPTFSVGDTVKVVIDGEKRDKLRKLHSLAHIAYYFVEEKLGKLKVIGSNVTAEKARMDFLYHKPLNEVVPEIEEATNKFIEEGHEIKREFDSEKPDLLWWICETWKMPCGGTHVKNTKEIGKIKLKRKNIGAGKERIEMVLTE
ncbi:alanyl-tRNA editing protein [Candidatus Woesearchaeota archaeon CG10_big_fil_rev_8_21_14_0_10_37_12]|nr:MAG: alanyl-tRNA editing protein [Candidatus Woesearchaeota archaeon CG10_big_fil_rev_8_21_14_0_10_37_12]